MVKPILLHDNIGQLFLVDLHKLKAQLEKHGITIRSKKVCIDVSPNELNEWLENMRDCKIKTSHISIPSELTSKPSSED